VSDTRNWAIKSRTIKKITMDKKKYPDKPIEVPGTPPKPEIEPEIMPENPELPGEDPDLIPEEDPFENPPVEIPPPGEGP
jgi:hypothetical protein